MNRAISFALTVFAIVAIVIVGAYLKYALLCTYVYCR